MGMGKDTNHLRLMYVLSVSAVLMVLTFSDGLKEMVEKWVNKEQYSHGFFIPPIAAFLIWQQRQRMSAIGARGSWFGLVGIVVGLFGMFLGSLATVYVVAQYSFLVTLYGFIVAAFGWRVFRALWAPLLFLLFMIPLPQFLYQGLSQDLQLISSELGVLVIRLMGVSVYLEGNIIDLGPYKLQVVEACSGLKYLFSLTSLGFLCAYLFQGAVWKRIVIFLSAVPITIFMNSFRVGVTGVLVEYWGVSHAEGFLHQFEGLAIFGAAMGVLLLEMAILARIGRSRTTLREAFSLSRDEGEPDGSTRGEFRVAKSAVASVVLLAVGGLTAYVLAERQEIIPDRQSFAAFPDRFSGWRGAREGLEQKYLDELVLDDYLLSEFSDDNGASVNFYVAYYASQRAGESAHSPRSCLPGGGWEIQSLQRRELTDIQVNGSPLEVNRVLIQMGEFKQLVYYWFQQRGRTITSEYLVKWYLFWDALTRNRTDGALVRLTTRVRPGETVADGDRRLRRFARDVSGLLPEYIPD